MPFVATHTFTSTEGLNAAKMNAIQANVNYLYNGRTCLNVSAQYNASWSLGPIAASAANNSSSANNFAQIDANSPLPGATAISNIVTSSGRISGVYTFTSGIGSNTLQQAWFTVGVLSGAYNGTFVDFDLNTTSLTGVQSTGQGNAAGEQLSVAIVLPFVITGLTPGTSYSVIPYWRAWGATAGAGGNGGSVTVTCYGTNLIRGWVWEM